MRCMVLIKATEKTEAGVLPTAAQMAAMDKFGEEMIEAGVVVLDGAGLKPTSKGARIVFSGGKPTVLDGPFAETKELVAGFSMIQVKSLAEAIELLSRGPFDGGEIVEIRPLYEAEDFA